MEIPVTLKTTQEALLAKKISVVGLVDAYLARIDAFDAKLNALLTVCKNEAYRTAKQLDQTLKVAGDNAFVDKPLLGSIVICKDLFLTQGIRTTASSKVLDNYVPQYSATVVKRLENAGCVIVGKANNDAWAHGASGENSDYGPTKNPWNLDYVPGGSSSGSAASVAANFCLLATGTDTGGSIRQPANFCGVVGLKPTYGSVSRYGIVAMASSLDSIGHFTHTVEDAEKVFDVTKGEDGKDSTVKNADFVRPPLDRKMRIGLPKEYFVGGLEKDVEAAVRAVSEVYKKQGVEVVEVSLPHTKYAISVYYIVQPAEVSSNLGRYDGIRYGNPRESFGSEAKRRIMLGTYVLSAGYYDAYYLKAMKVRSKIIEDFDNAFSKVDAILAPVSPTSAFKLGEKADNPLQMYLADIFTVAANLAGIPGLAVPSGFNAKGLPLGFQLLGARFSEPILFELGKVYEKSTSWSPKIAQL